MVGHKNHTAAPKLINKRAIMALSRSPEFILINEVTCDLREILLAVFVEVRYTLLHVML